MFCRLAWKIVDSLTISERFSVIEMINLPAIFKNYLIWDYLTKSFFSDLIQFFSDSKAEIVFSIREKVIIWGKIIFFILFQFFCFFKNSGLMIISSNFLTISPKSKNENWIIGFSVWCFVRKSLTVLAT